MSRTMSLLMLLFAMIIMGCTSVAPVTLQHPTTHTKVTCPGESYYYFAEGALIQQRQAQCISDYQRQGYERVPE